MATTFGLDISHHQDPPLDLEQCAREGIDFVFIKATEGSNYQDPAFRPNLAEAQRAGLIPAAYHYVRAAATAAAQVDNVKRTVPPGVPVIPDIEDGSGDVPLAREVVQRLEAAGYRVPLMYLPRWYWQRLGSPSLAGLPPLWSSRYPDNVVGSIADEIADVLTSYWTGYGGLDVAVLQFTSSSRIAGRQPIDANAYRGTRDQLAALLGGTEEDMAGEGQNILAAVLTGGDSTRSITFDDVSGQVKLPLGVDPTALLGRLADVQFALTKTLPRILEELEALRADVAALKGEPQ